MSQQLLAVSLVLGLLFAALWLLRRKGLASLPGMPVLKGGAPRRMRVLERVPLTAQHSLHLVALPGRLLVVGVSPASCRALAVLDDNAPSESVPGETAR